MNQSDVNRFWKRVDVRSHDECWEWRGGIGKKGYGHISVNGKTIMVHRFSFEIHFQSIPNGLQVLHACDNTVCVNPNHLFLGTNLDNMRDKAKKKRGNAPRGERHGNHKLTEKQVLEIRELSKNNSQIKIASMFGVSSKHISDILNFKKWSWMKG